MKVFFLDKFDNIENYGVFIEYMLIHSDSFSFIYFKYHENEKMKKSAKAIFHSLNAYKILSKRTKKWPGTETRDEKNIYKIVLYRSDVKCKDILLKANDIYDWNYPEMPMDLCFYKQGYCWFVVTSHEHTAYLYTNDKTEIEELRRMGANLVFCNDDEEPFRCDFV